MLFNTRNLPSVSLLFLISPAMALTLPPPNAITVGKNGKYNSLTKALMDTSSNVYFVYPGTYPEQVVIDRPNIRIYGQTSKDDLTYASNQVTVTNSVSAAVAGSDAKSGTVQVGSSGVSIYNMNIVNTYGKPAAESQAIALSVQAREFGSYGCKLIGYQDTLLAYEGNQFYGNCFIEGAVDFIFGYGSIWITRSVLNTVGNGYITASGRSTNDNSYFVIDHSQIIGTGKQFLGRPWRDFARVIVQNTEIGSHIDAAGWSQWSTSSPTDHILFGEYNNHGDGAWKTGRALFAAKLSAGVSISTVLGSTSWIDPAYL